jgi:hypothetical protein
MGPSTARDVPNWSLEGVQRIRTTVHLCLVSYLLAIVGTRTVLSVDTAHDLIVPALALSAALGLVALLTQLHHHHSTAPPTVGNERNVS